MKANRLLIALLILFLASTRLLAQTQGTPGYTFKVFNVNSPIFFVAGNAINDGGVVAGEYMDIPSGGQGSLSHAFMGSDPPVNIDPPGSPVFSFARAVGINKGGQIVGWSSSFGNFLRDAGGAFQNIDNTNSSFSQAVAINDAGEVLYLGGATGAFVCKLPVSASCFTDVTLPFNSLFHFHALTFNNAGTLAGSVLDRAGNFHGFISTTLVDEPNGLNCAGFAFTEIRAVNDDGDTVGLYLDHNCAEHGFLRTSSGEFVTIDPNGSTNTEARGINNSGQITGWFEDQNGGNHAFIATPQPRCQVDFQRSITSFAGGPPSADGQPTSMNGLFLPHDFSGQPMSLASAAAACGFDGGFDGFNWQQEVKVLPRPSPYATVEGTPLVTPFLDPPTAGGYTYDPVGTGGLNPFYYGPHSCAFRDSTNVCVIPVELGDNVLNFYDAAPDPCLLGCTGEGCFGLTAPPSPNSELKFTTRLVGVLHGSPVMLPNSEWSWTSTFNGTSGGTAKLNDSAVDPGSGTGGVMITSINGVPQAPPNVSCTVAPTTLWPPNGKPVVVSVSGNITPGTQAIPSGGTTYSLIDEYGQVQPSGSVALDAGGTYSLEVSLLAARNGNDRDGRTYTIIVSARDNIGNDGSCSSVVTVAHDQRH